MHCLSQLGDELAVQAVKSCVVANNHGGVIASSVGHGLDGLDDFSGRRGGGRRGRGLKTTSN